MFRSDQLLRRGDTGKLRPFGIKQFHTPCKLHNDEDWLLIGQLHYKFSKEAFKEWALGLYGVEYRAEQAHCLVIAIDVESGELGCVRVFHRDNLAH